MIDALKFVRGAVAKKDFVPELTHFRIENNTIKGFNGSLALCSPIELDLEITPKALPFIKAITSCKETTSMHVTPTGRLSIKSGRFKAFVECINEPYPDIFPEGDKVEIDGTFIQILRKLAPYMAEDASRPWARGILLRGRSAYVTNNIIMVQAWLPKPFPVEVNIPASAIKELIRIKEEPCILQLSSNSATFHYKSGRWLRTQLSSLDWPNVNPILEVEAEPKPVIPGMFEALEDLKHFGDEAGRVIIDGDILKTSPDKDIGASMQVEGLCGQGVFNIKQLSMLAPLVERIDLNMYPSPSLFYGEMLRGVIIGIRP